MSKAKQIIAKEARAINPYPVEELEKDYIPVDPAGGIKLYANAEGQIVDANKTKKELINLEESDDSKHYPVADKNAIIANTAKVGYTDAAVISVIDTERPDPDYLNSNVDADDVGLGNVDNPSIVSKNMGVYLDDSSRYVVGILDHGDSTSGSAEFHIYSEDGVDIRFVVSAEYDSGWTTKTTFLSNIDVNGIFDEVMIQSYYAFDSLYVVITTNTETRSGTIYCKITNNKYFEPKNFVKTTTSMSTEETYTLTDSLIPSVQGDIDDRLSSTEKDLIDFREEDTIISLDDDTLYVITVQQKDRTYSKFSGYIDIVGYDINVSLKFSVSWNQVASEWSSEITVLNNLENLDVGYSIEVIEPDSYSEYSYVCFKSGSDASGVEVKVIARNLSPQTTLNVAEVNFTYDTIDSYILNDKIVAVNTNDIEDERSEVATLTNKSINCNPEAANPNIITGALVTASFEVNFDDDDGSGYVVLMDAQNIIIQDVHVVVKEVWDGTLANNVLKVGDEDDDDGFITDLGGAGADVLDHLGIKTEQLCLRSGGYFYATDCDSPRKVKYYGTTSKEIRATLDYTDAAHGVAVIYIQYTKLS